MSILRTRPETIHLWSIVERLDRYTDHVLGVGMGSLGGTLDEILPEVEKVLIRERPEAVRILGGTNSATSAITARKMKIPTNHINR